LRLAGLILYHFARQKFLGLAGFTLQVPGEAVYGQLDRGDFEELSGSELEALASRRCLCGLFLLGCHVTICQLIQPSVSAVDVDPPPPPDLHARKIVLSDGSPQVIRGLEIIALVAILDAL
jgi:hypothetical protein